MKDDTARHSSTDDEEWNDKSEHEQDEDKEQEREDAAPIKPLCDRLPWSLPNADTDPLGRGIDSAFRDVVVVIMECIGIVCMHFFVMGTDPDLLSCGPS